MQPLHGSHSPELCRGVDVVATEPTMNALVLIQSSSANPPYDIAHSSPVITLMQHTLPIAVGILNLPANLGATML